MDPWKIRVKLDSESPNPINSFSNLPSLATLPTLRKEELDVHSGDSIEVSDPPIPLQWREEQLWYNLSVKDRSAQLYLLGAVLRQHGLRDDLIISALARHPLCIEKYEDRSLREAGRIVEKLAVAPPDSGELVEKLLTWNWLDFMTRPTQIRWLVEEAWIEQSVGFISGRAKAYKSWLMLDLSVAVATGTPFLGQFDVPKPGPVLIIQEEDPHSVIQSRLGLITTQRGLSPRYSKANSWMEIDFPDMPIYIINLQGFKLDKQAKVSELMKIIREVQPKLLVLDPFINMVTELDEYRGTQVANILQIIKGWREEFDCAVIVVHHWNKKATTTNTGGPSMYGSFAFHAWLESALHVRPVVEDDQLINEVIVEREFKAVRPGPPFRVTFERVTDEFTARYAPQVTSVDQTTADTIIDIVSKTPNVLHSDLVKLTGMPTKALTRLVNKCMQGNKIEAVNVGGDKRKRMAYRIVEGGN